MYDDTITMFNLYPSRAGDLWIPTTLNEVDLQINKATIKKVYGENSNDNALCHIRYHKELDDIIINDKVYVEPKEWTAKLTDELEAFITFSPNNCFIFKGLWDKGIVDDTEYQKGKYDGFLDYMKITQDNVYVVTSVNQYKVIPHYELTAK